MYTDLDLDDLTRRLGPVSNMVLGPGNPGAFDQDGVIPSYADSDSDGKQIVTLLYSGWTAPSGMTPYHNATGIAMSTNGGRTFDRMHEGPIMDRLPYEPYLRVTPARCEGDIWYVSGLRWERINDKYEPIYVIRMASASHVNPIVIPQKHELECFSRPWVTKRENGIFEMLYSYRSAVDYRAGGPGAYRLGNAQSHDGENWERLDNIEVPRSDFDKQMQAYAAVFVVNSKRYMLYNGDSFGKYGFGLAVEE